MYVFFLYVLSKTFIWLCLIGGRGLEWQSKLKILYRSFYLIGKLQAHKWENAMTIDRYSWGYRRNAPLSNYLSIEDLLKTFITTVSCGGNMLMNVGPTSYGRIVPIMEERLKQMGEWLTVNGDAIYGTRPWSHQNDTLTKDVW